MSKYRVQTKDPIQTHEVEGDSYEWQLKGPSVNGILMLSFFAKGIAVAEFKADQVILVRIVGEETS